MLPYKLTFLSEVDLKNHNDIPDVEYPEESSPEMNDFDVEQINVVSVNGPFETQYEETWTQTDILDLDSQPKTPGKNSWTLKNLRLNYK